MCENVHENVESSGDRGKHDTAWFLESPSMVVIKPSLLHLSVAQYVYSITAAYFPFFPGAHLLVSSHSDMWHNIKPSFHCDHPKIFLICDAI